MNLPQLAHLCQLLERHKIPATQLTIKGKPTKRLSFTCPKKYFERVLKLAADNDLGFKESYDIFLPKTKTRYHLIIRRLKP